MSDALTGRATQEKTNPREPQDFASTRSARRRCLVLAGHLGTAGTLKLILQRYVATDVAPNGIAAVRLLGTTLPDCVICDAHGWAAEGAAFLRVLRAQHPMCRVALLTAGAEENGRIPDGEGLADTVIPQGAGLGELVRRALLLCAPDDWNARQILSDYVMRAMDYLRLRYAEVVTAEAVARAAGLSRSRLAELFRAGVGISLSQYVAALRVEVAKLLLDREAPKLTEIATLAGFCDSSHFSRVFRVHTGQRPGAYRREFTGR